MSFKSQRVTITTS